MPTTLTPSHAAVRRLVDRQHTAAQDALSDSAERPLDAVAWISAHVAVSERVLLRAVRRAVPDARDVVRQQRAVDHELQRAAWRLDRRLTGDVLTSRVPAAAMLSTVRSLLREHVAIEDGVLAALAVVDEDVVSRLHDDLNAATAHAPTRPHPFTPVGPGASVAFRIEAMVDRVRDALDARHVPVPRERPPRHPPGRWGIYALGVPELPEPPQARSDADG